MRISGIKDPPFSVSYSYPHPQLNLRACYEVRTTSKSINVKSGQSGEVNLFYISRFIVLYCTHMAPHHISK